MERLLSLPRRSFVGRRRTHCVLVPALVVCCFCGALRAAAQPDLAAPKIRHAALGNGVEAKVELAGGSGWQEELVYELFFVADDSELTVDVPQADGRVNRVTVYRISLADTSKALAVQKCRLLDGLPRCETVEVHERIPRTGKLVELTIPSQRVDWDVDFFRVSLGEARYALTATDANGNALAAAVLPSAAVQGRTLPTLADLERQYVQQRPFLRMRLSPLVRDHEEGGSAFDELAASFEGGIYRPSADGNRLWQLNWEGDVATRKHLAFDRMALEAGGGINLRKRDWLPLTLGATVEADRDLDALDVSAAMRVRHILPFNIHIQSGPYRPALAPRVEVLAAGGYAAHREDAPESEEAFFRTGYALRWRIPMAQTAALRIHQASTWNTANGAAPRWHLLWDLLFETELGGVTYYVGYQKGEAAPLFSPTETTRIGFALATAGVRRR